MNALRDAIAAGELDGYAARPPVSVVFDTADIDRALCAESRCAACGRSGLDYRPYSKTGSYRAFAVCPACGASEEF